MQKTREYLSGWEIIEWNEDTYDLEGCDYAKEAYEHGKYAFASDYARFDLLYQYGGVYVDTDVELLKPIPEEMLEDVGFTGVEGNLKIAPGLIFACEAGNPVVKEILDDYRNDHFIDETGQINGKTVVERTTDIFLRYGFRRDGSEQEIAGFHIYPAEYFCAYDFVTNEFTITEKTVSIHHYAATWIGPKAKIRRFLKNTTRKMLGIERYKKVIGIKRKLFGVHGE